MPNIWTHILFCEEVVDAISKPTTPNFTYDNIMKLGAQGPDIFFYYRFWPWLKPSSIERLGIDMHTKQCGPFLIDLIETAKTGNKKVQAYVIGFITHHILDRNTHPYIHYYAGYNGNDHQRLEVIIDTILTERYYHLKTWKSSASKEIDVGFSLPKEIVQLLEKNIHKHYPNYNLKLSTYIQRSYRDIKRAQYVLHDPYGWKNKIFPHLVSAYSHRPVIDKYDYLNEKHHVWYHAATEDPSTKSFMDLYHQSILEAKELVEYVLLYWKVPKKSLQLQIERLVGNISYDTGTDLSLHLTNQFSKRVFRP